MIKSFKSVLPLFKIAFLISLLLLFVWVIPSIVSYYKNSKIYVKKVEELTALDERTEAKLDAKPFHTEVFRADAKESFDDVQVTAIEDNAYRIFIHLKEANLSSFYTYLKNLSLNYAISVQEPIIFENKNGTIKVTIVVKPYL